MPGRTSRVRLAGALALLLAACGASRDPTAPRDLGPTSHTFAIYPQAATVVVNGMPGSQAFDAWFDNQCVSDRALWNLGANTAGIISRGLFTSNYPTTSQDVTVGAEFTAAGTRYTASAKIDLIWMQP